MTITTVGNFQSKRKTPTCITFYRNERMFGADAMALMSRKPELTFAKAYRMLGTYVPYSCLFLYQFITLQGAFICVGCCDVLLFCVLCTTEWHFNSLKQMIDCRDVIRHKIVATLFNLSTFS